jgi:hypothetical protein
MSVLTRIRHNMELLKPEYREMLHRVELEEVSLRETAATLGLTPNNASVRLHRARQALRLALMHMCGTCAEHGCLDCTCRPPHLPEETTGSVRHAEEQSRAT